MHAVPDLYMRADSEHPRTNPVPPNHISSSKMFFFPKSILAVLAFLAVSSSTALAALPAVPSSPTPPGARPIHPHRPTGLGAISTHTNTQLLPSDSSCTHLSAIGIVSRDAFHDKWRRSGCGRFLEPRSSQFLTPV
ncbi:hypothetical protein DFH09DRAFT_1324040 [Mycena vulgaris]|nr:hypothetical protein DFH09DRAFT_1324040 [Mycena vulgaris]